MIMRRYWGGIAVASVLAFCGTLNGAQAAAPTPNLPNVAEVYKFDAACPKPLPNNWIMGTVTGMSVDQDDHTWVLDRPGTPPAGNTPPPAVLKFDIDATLRRPWAPNPPPPTAA